jgi:hypothetical protein
MGWPVPSDRPDVQRQAGGEPAGRHRIRQSSSELRTLRQREEGEDRRVEAEVGHLGRQPAAQQSSGCKAVEADSVRSRSYWSGAG